jgi:TolB-like protein
VTEGDREGQATGANTGTPDVFISYASQDAALADAVVSALESHGVKCWIAPRDVTPGEFYAGSIVHAIDAAKVTVLILSQNSAASPHVVREVERAASKRHPVVSLRIDQAPLPADLEYFLNTSQWLDASGGEPARVMPKLVAAIRVAIDKPSTPEPAIAGAPVRASHAAGDGWSPRRNAIVAGFVMIAAIAGFAAYRSLRPAHQVAALATATAPTRIPAAPAIPEKSVAVLPFVDMSEKKDQEYFSDGLTEELIDHMAQTPDLKVIARTSSFQFKGKSEDIRAIASKLGVAHLLEGSVRKSGTTMRITAQLIRASDGSHLWSHTYDRRVADVFKVQDEIANKVTQALKVTLSPNARPSAMATNADAYDVLLKGDFVFRRQNAGDLEKALALYQEAARIDPNYALAWAKIGNVHHRMGWGGVPTAETRSKAYTAAERALQIDPNLALTHRVLGKIYRDFDWDWIGARSEFEKVLELDPNNNDVRSDLGYLNWMETGDIAEEITALRQDLIRDPLDTGAYWSLGVSYWAAERFEESAATFERLLAMKPDYASAQALYAQTLLFLGRGTSALAAVNQEADELHKLLILPSIYWALGRHRESDEALIQLETRYAHVAPTNIAEVHAFRGEIDSAFKWLERAYQQRDSYIANIKFDPYLRKMRADPRFSDLLRKLKLPE